MKKLIVTGAFFISSLVSFSAGAAQMSEEEMQQKAVSDRQAVFKLLSVSMGPLGGMARGGEFDMEAAVLSAERIKTLAGMIPALFNTDTSSNGDLTTRSADTIWGGKADFDGLAADLASGAQAAIDMLNDQGASGIRGAVGQIGPKCGACHDRFRLD